MAAVEETTGRIERTGDQVADEVEVAQAVVETMEATSDGVAEISAAADDQAHDTEEVRAVVTEVAPSAARSARTLPRSRPPSTTRPRWPRRSRASLTD
jgi:methyl-accepting chemotaxis protein